MRAVVVAVVVVVVINSQNHLKAVGGRIWAVWDFFFFFFPPSACLSLAGGV
jgi:hypothetical protein